MCVLYLVIRLDMEQQAGLFKDDILRGVSLSIKNVSYKLQNGF